MLLAVGFLGRMFGLLILISVSALGVSGIERTFPSNTSEALFRDEFGNLDGWREWEFDAVDRPTRYEIREKEQRTVLRMEATSSASGLILEKNFSTVQDVRVRWRWRADVLPTVSDPVRRKGDDFAIRVYVIFEQDASDAGWLERWVLRNAPFRDQGILPENSLAYAWTDAADLPDSYPNPYTDRVFVIPVKAPEAVLGQWQEVEVTPVADYRDAFGKEPPPHFRLAIMSDADDSGSTALGWLDFIEIRPK